MARHAEKLLRRIEFTVARRLEGMLHGDYRTLFRGFGLDLADLREYQYHDDVRHIDWNVTARLQQTHVRDYHEDREVAAWFLMDLSPSIDFGSGEVTKRSVAVDFVALMARLLTSHGNRVGAIRYGDKIDRVVPSGGGRRHVLALLDALLAPRVVTSRTTTNLAHLLEQSVPLLKRRSVVFVVSDFMTDPGWARGLHALTRRHEVIAVRLHDPLESRLPDLGMIVVEDSETGERLFVDTHDAGVRRRFERQVDERETALRDEFARAGVDALELATDEPLADAVVRFAEMRKMRSRLGGGLAAGGRGRGAALVGGAR
jgi:uncharacterized protein (DUF58 family)